MSSLSNGDPFDDDETGSAAAPDEAGPSRDRPSDDVSTTNARMREASDDDDDVIFLSSDDEPVVKKGKNSRATKKNKMEERAVKKRREARERIRMTSQQAQVGTSSSMPCGDTEEDREEKEEHGTYLSALNLLLDRYERQLLNLSSLRAHKAYSREEVEDRLKQHQAIAETMGPRYQFFRQLATIASSPSPKDPRAIALYERFTRVWEQSANLKNRLNYDLEKPCEISFENWRLRLVEWVNEKKSRRSDFYWQFDQCVMCRMPKEAFLKALKKCEVLNVVVDTFVESDGTINTKIFISECQIGRPRFDLSRPMRKSVPMKLSERQTELHQKWMVEVLRIIRLEEGGNFDGIYPDPHGQMEKEDESMRRYMKSLRRTESKMTIASLKCNQPPIYFENWTGKTDNLPKFKFIARPMPSKKVQHALKNCMAEIDHRCGEKCIKSRLCQLHYIGSPKKSTKKEEEKEEKKGEKKSKTEGPKKKKGRNEKKRRSAGTKRKNDSCGCRKAINSNRFGVECNEQCGCDKNCRNRDIQAGQQEPLLVFRHHLKGWTLRSLSRYNTDDFIIEMVGEVLTHYEALTREWSHYSIAQDIWRKRTMDGGEYEHNTLVIDSVEYSNISRFFAHSCVPNCKMYVTYVERAGQWYCRIAVRAKRPIEFGEELTLDYHPSLRLADRGKAKNHSYLFLHCWCGNGDQCKFVVTPEVEKAREKTEEYIKRQQQNAEESGDSWSETDDDGEADRVRQRRMRNVWRIIEEDEMGDYYEETKKKNKYGKKRRGPFREIRAKNDSGHEEDFDEEKDEEDEDDSYRQAIEDESSEDRSNESSPFLGEHEEESETRRNEVVTTVKDVHMSAYLDENDFSLSEDEKGVVDSSLRTDDENNINDLLLRPSGGQRPLASVSPTVPESNSNPSTSRGNTADAD